METKTCKTCGIEKDLSCFRRDHKRWYRGTCKECDSKSHKEWLKSNRDKVLGYHKKHYLKYRTLRPRMIKQLSDYPKRECMCGCGELISPRETFLKKTGYRCVYYPKYVEGHKRNNKCLFCGKKNPAKKFKYCSTLCKNRARLKRDKSNGKYQKWLKRTKNSDYYFKYQFSNRSDISPDQVSVEVLEAYKTFIQLKREVRSVRAKSI